ncbi:60 kDa inner membrane insertion protein, partial [mine drainage metagenome]
MVPPAGQPFRFTSQVSGSDYLLAATGPNQTVAPGATLSLTQRLFVGPTLHGQLVKTDSTLGYLDDYGFFTILARPLFWLLSRVHGVTGNWGVAIIIVTILLKLLFYPLSEASGRSMAKMKALGPRIKAIQESYKDDKEKLGRAMMEIYKREKVNPVAG